MLNRNSFAIRLIENRFTSNKITKNNRKASNFQKNGVNIPFSSRKSRYLNPNFLLNKRKRREELSIYLQGTAVVPAGA